MGFVEQTSLFWDVAIEVAKRSGSDEVTRLLTVGKAQTIT